MKKLFLSFAALAAIVSCVEEKGLEPQQPVSGNQLTIKAVTAPATKTVLGDELPAEGISVLWEEEDAITVLLKDGNSGTAYKEFTAAQVDGTNADFTGEFTAADLEYFDTENVTAAYAVYPSASVSDGVITHTLSEEQNGEITSGMNLAYAALDADEVLNGTATSASFNNALALIQITVPADVMYVSLSTGNYGDELAGTATYTYSQGVLTRSSISGYKRTVTLKDGDAPLAAGTYSLLVFPSTKNNTLTLKMEGTDGAVYEKSLNDIKLMASQCYTINLEKLSYVGEVLPASPVGGEFVIPFVTTEDYTYTVNVEIEEGDDENWIVYEETRGFHQDEIVLALETNDSGKERSANVTVTIENVGSKTFVVSQPSVFMELIKDENGDPIQWEETFAVYSTEEDASAGTNAVKTFTNVFTIELSDNFSNGTYKVSGIFAYNNSYSGKTGGIYYADYADGVLTIYKETAENQSYAFTEKEVKLNYDSVNKTFSSASIIEFGYKFDNADLRNGGFIGGYTVAVKEEESNVDAGPLAAFIGKWSESFTNSYFMGQGEYNNVEGITVSIVDGKLYFEKMFAITYSGSPLSGSYYGTLSADGKTITLEDANPSSPHSGFGPMEYSSTNPIVLNVSDGKLTASTALYGYLSNYVATR